jgi:carbamoyl-phosphate synthase large subunit
MRLSVRGLMNIQFAVKDGAVYLIEVNPRASRTVPFVAKAIGHPIAKIAARVMAGEKAARLPQIDRAIDHVAVKEAVFPFNRFPGCGSRAQSGDEEHRRSHGDRSRFRHRLCEGRSSARARCCPLGGTLFVSVKDSDKPIILPAVRDLVSLGLPGRRDRLARRGSSRTMRCRWRRSTRSRRGGRTSSIASSTAISRSCSTPPKDGSRSRTRRRSGRAGLANRVPYFTTAAASVAAVQAIGALRDRNLEVRPLQSYYLKSQV